MFFLLCGSLPYLLVDHVSDELYAGCAAYLVVALEAALEVENETLEQQLPNIRKLINGAAHYLFIENVSVTNSL